MTSKEDFVYDMRVIRSTRFVYSKRMEVKSKVKSFTINTLSVLAIFVSVYLLANASGISALDLKRISITLIGISLLALWMSLDTPPSELSRKAADAHQCAREISEIYRACKYDQIELIKAVECYETILSRYPENHDPLDRANALYNDRRKNPEKAERLTCVNTVWKYNLSCYSPVGLALGWFLLVALIQIFFPL